MDSIDAEKNASFYKPEGRMVCKQVFLKPLNRIKKLDISRLLGFLLELQNIHKTMTVPVMNEIMVSNFF